MKREDLKKLELSDEAIDEIMKMHGKDIEQHKSQLETTTEELQTLQSQYEDASKTIEGFKSMDIESVKQTAEEWKEKAEKYREDAENMVKALKFDHALDNSLREARAKNPKAVKALLEVDELEFDDEKNQIKGLEDQLESVKTENDYLFESDEDEPKITTQTKSKKVIGDSTVITARRAAGLPPE